MIVNLTRYYLTCQEDFGSNNIIPIKDPKGRVLALMDPMCYASFALEGCGRLLTGAVLNVTGTYLDCTPEIAKSLLYVATKLYRGKKSLVGLSMDATRYLAFSKVNSPWGLGVKNTPLQPFIHVAADKKIYPYGTKLYIKELDGVILPNKIKSDGVVTVVDVGGSITGEHLDLFCGTKQMSKQLKLPQYCEVMKKV